MQVFDTVSAENAHFNQYQLTAAIAYYGRHYSTFCHHSRKREWIYFDDANFRTVMSCRHVWSIHWTCSKPRVHPYFLFFQIGMEWSDVCEVIRKAHYQPLLLVYSNPFAETIDVSQVSLVGTLWALQEQLSLNSLHQAKTYRLLKEKEAMYMYMHV